MAMFAEIELWRAPVDTTENAPKKGIDGSIPPIIHGLFYAVFMPRNLCTFKIPCTSYDSFIRAPISPRIGKC